MNDYQANEIRLFGSDGRFMRLVGRVDGVPVIVRYAIVRSAV
jgi:hypothetical protein